MPLSDDLAVLDPLARRGATQVGHEEPGRQHRPGFALPSERVVTTALLALVLVVAAGVRLWHFNAVGYNSDEAVYAGQAASIAHDPNLAPYFPVFRAHPLLFQSIVSFGYQFGWGDWYGRVAAIVFGLLTVLLTFELGRFLYGRRAGLLAAGALAVMPYHVVVTRQVLLDGPQTFFTTLALYLLARYAASERRTWLLATGSALGLSVLAKEPSILLLRRRLRLLRALPAGAPCGCATSLLAGAVMAVTIIPYPLSIAFTGRTHTGGNFLAWQLFRRPNHSFLFYPVVVPVAIGLAVCGDRRGGARDPASPRPLVVARDAARVVDRGAGAVLRAVAGQGLPVPARRALRRWRCWPPGRCACRRRRSAAASSAAIPTERLRAGRRGPDRGHARLGHGARRRRRRRARRSWPAPAACRAVASSAPGCAGTCRRARRSSRSGRRWPTSSSSTATGRPTRSRSARTRCTGTRPTSRSRTPTSRSARATVQYIVWDAYSAARTHFFSRSTALVPVALPRPRRLHADGAGRPRRPRPGARHRRLRGALVNRRLLTPCSRSPRRWSRRGRGAGRRPGADDADPPLRLPDAGEPHVRQLLRHLPGRRRPAPRTCACRTTSSDPVQGLREARVPRLAGGARPRPQPDGVQRAVRRREDGWLRRRLSRTRARPRRLPMGYYDDRDIPYYYNVADNYVLFDRFFSSARAGSRTNHVFWVTGAPGSDGSTTRSRPVGFGNLPTIFDRLQAAGVSWKFYVQNYDPTNTFRTPASGDRASQIVWVPLLTYARYLDNPTLNSHIQDLSQYYVDAAGRHAARRRLHRPGRVQRAPARADPGRADVRAHDHQRADAELRLAVVGVPVGLRRLGRLVRPRRAAEGRRRTATGSASRRCSSAPTPARGYVDHTTTRLHVGAEVHRAELAAAAARRAATPRPPASPSAFDFTQPPRRPVLLDLTRTQPKRQVVRTAVVYQAYGAALLSPLVIVLLGAGALLRARRRGLRSRPT